MNTPEHTNRQERGAHRPAAECAPDGTVRCPDCWNGKVIPCAIGCRAWDECCGKHLHGPCQRCGGSGRLRARVAGAPSGGQDKDTQ